MKGSFSKQYEEGRVIFHRVHKRSLVEQKAATVFKSMRLASICSICSWLLLCPFLFWSLLSEDLFTGTTGLDAVVLVGGLMRVERENHDLQPAGNTSVCAARGVICLLNCKCTLLAHVQISTSRYPAVPGTANPNQISAPSVPILGIAPTQVQDFALALVFPEVHLGPFF